MEWLGLFAQWGILIAATASLVIARKIARQRATLDFIHQYNSEKRVTPGIRAIVNYNNEPMEEYLKPDGENRENFLLVMNMLEILAIGLKHSIYDKKIAIDMFGDDLREIYSKARPLIEHIRKTGGGNAYVHIEQLASKVETRLGR